MPIQSVVASYVKRDSGAIWLDSMNNVRAGHICLGDTAHYSKHSNHDHEAKVSRAFQHIFLLCLCVRDPACGNMQLNPFSEGRYAILMPFSQGIHKALIYFLFI